MTRSLTWFRSRTGRKGPYACYYVQISPHGKSFVGELSHHRERHVQGTLTFRECEGAGLWMPEAAPLALLRRDIVRKPEKLRKVLTDPAMRKHILGGIANDPKKAVKAFAGQNQDNALKTAPKVSLSPSASVTVDQHWLCNCVFVNAAASGARQQTVLSTVKTPELRSTIEAPRGMVRSICA
jgi:uncharacterized protein (DUF2461 family)